LDHQQTIQRIFEAGGAGQVTFAEKVSHMPTGKFIFAARPKITTQLAAFMLGVDTPGAPVSGVTPHVITDDMATDYQSIEHNLGNDATERFVDCTIAELIFACDLDNPALRVTATWVGCTPAYQASPTSATYETDNPFQIYDGVFTVDGSVAANVRKFTLTVRVKLSVERIAKVTPEYIVKLGEECELELENLVTTTMSDEYRKTQYGAVGANSVANTPTPGAFIADFSYGAAGTARELKLEVPLLDYDDAKYTPLASDANEATKVTRTGAARRTSGGASPLFRLTGKTTDAGAYV
jgi:hypothetical protein